MTKNLQIYYDKEGDYFELHIGPYTKGHFKEVRQGILERIDAKTKQVTGIAIVGFSKRMARTKEFKIPLSLFTHA